MIDIVRHRNISTATFCFRFFSVVFPATFTDELMINTDLPVLKVQVAFGQSTELADANPCFQKNNKLIKVLGISLTTEVVAHKLADYYRKTETHFFVCGYNDDIPYVYDVYGTVVKRSNVSEPIPENAKSKDVAADDNPPEVGTPENIKETIIDEKSDRLVEPMITYGALWAGQKTAITKIVNNPPILNADWGTMPLTDAIDFSEFLVDTTIKYERFCDDIQTCGGDIDILVITKDDAFWKQHKIYNPIKK